MTKLFIGGLPYSINNEKLNDLFSQFGQVLSAAVITDKFTNQSKGFGFVEFADDASAQDAIKNLDGTELEGRRLGVSVAKPKEDKPYSNSGFNNNRGNNRNGGRDGGRDNSRGFSNRGRR
jgi:RNA recognition motif-containing protein